MGFTRYWTIKKEIPKRKFDKFIEYAKIVVVHNQTEGMKLGDFGGEDEPIFEKELLGLNGTGDEAHESFVIRRIPKICEWDRKNDGWEFCKTNAKPYDRVVYELLYLARHIFGDKYFVFNGDDDGEVEDGDTAYDITNLNKIINRDIKIGEIIGE